MTMYHQADLDRLDSNQYDEFLFWSGQISQKPLDPTPDLEYNTHMKDLELLGDALEEYTQAQVFEAMADASEITDEEIEAWADLWLQKETA